MIRRSSVRFGSLAAACVLACLVLAGPASASDQFTLDAHGDSFGAIVTDAAGDAYITWNHRASPNDVPTFCKLKPGARHCLYRVSLALPGNPSSAASLQPFPILGPNGLVLVVASRYVDDDTVIWTSTDGGKRFGSPRDIPYIPTPDPSLNGDESYSYSGLTGVDDLVPLNFTNYGLYDQGTSAGVLPGNKTGNGIPGLVWIESSTGSSTLGWNLDDNDEVAGGYPGVTEFTFNNPGNFVTGSTLGVSGFGSTSPNATTDWVEAYWTDTTPYALDYYYYTYRGPGSAAPVQSSWSGPHSLGDGYSPRLAGGPAGLFLLSVNGSGTPTSVQIRKYDPVTHSFRAPLTLEHEPSGGELFYGGGLGENLSTGELAAVWPQLGTSAGDLLRLYTSRDGGKHFSKAQYVAHVDGFQDDDNARVAVADSGTGFVTFEDAAGLQIADLYPLGTEYKRLARSKGPGGSVSVRVPVTCPAVRGRCKVSISLTPPRRAHPAILASHKFSVAPGTSTLKLELDSAGIALLAVGHGRTAAILTIVVGPPHAAAHTITADVTIG